MRDLPPANWAGTSIAELTERTGPCILLFSEITTPFEKYRF